MSTTSTTNSTGTSFGNNVSTTDNDRLTISDGRTGSRYQIPIHDDHFIQASEFKSILANGAGLQLYDPAFVNTSVIKSAVSCVDGEHSVLTYRGYAIEELVEKSTFLEVAYLLIYGELPSAAQAKEWTHQIMTHTFVHANMDSLMRSFNYDAHPMGMFISAMAAMSTFHPEANPSLQGGQDLYRGNISLQNKQIKRIIGKVTTVAANAYRHRIGRPFNLPQSGLGYTENFLYMLDCLAEPDYIPHPVLANALDKLFIIHAEHEINCSTAAMLHISSTMVDPYSAIAGAAAALYGPLHGGANEAVLEMLEEIGSVENVPDFIQKVKQKEKRLMGFGHRVYKSYDPRAKLVRDILYQVFSVCGQEPLMLVAVALEKAALQDDYFVSRKLYPNVDFYTGLIFKGIRYLLILKQWAFLQTFSLFYLLFRDLRVGWPIGRSN